MLSTSPRVSTKDDSLVRALRDIAVAVNALASGRLSGTTNARTSVVVGDDALGDYVANSAVDRGLYRGWVFDGAVWFGVGQAGAIKGTTANRPTKTELGVPTNAGFSGYLYFDTTLDADGKPIWWTGTDWVDATGAVV